MLQVNRNKLYEHNTTKVFSGLSAKKVVSATDVLLTELYYSKCSCD